MFNTIRTEVPEHRILKRLGYSSRTSEVSPAALDALRRQFAGAADIIRLSACARRMKISLDGPKVLLSETEAVIESAGLARLLEGCDELLMLGITGGRAIAEAVAELQSGSMTEAVVYDAAAGEIVDAGFDWIAALYSREILREGRRLTGKRFSAGYGDFDIENQRIIYELLEMDRLGVSLTESCMLVPEKSVTAVYGIRSAVAV